MRFAFYLLITVCLLVVDCEQFYQKIIHKVDPEAKCLDGSPAAMYLHIGNPRKIMFYMEGGASCAGDSYSESLEHCYQRSKGYLGSSLNWPDTMIGEGILSRDPTKSFLADWTKIMMIYCDGAYHQGYTKDPFKYKDRQLYFRGSLNTRSHFKYIDQRFDLSQAEKVMLTGSSAGGIATYIWADYLKSLLSEQT